MAEDEAKPKTILYPRDLTLDPQLIQAGEAKQTRKSALQTLSRTVLQFMMTGKIRVKELSSAEE